MTREDALEVLKNAPRSNKPSRVNRSLTQAQAVQIVEDWIIGQPAGFVLSAIFEKRVWQVGKNQRRPR